MQNLIQGYFCGDINELKKVVRWGTFGKSGTEPLTFVKLIDCSTEHLKAILINIDSFNTGQMDSLVQIINSILEDRK